MGSFGGGDGLTGFQGEVKGAQANQGKISLGPTNMILRNHGLLTTGQTVAEAFMKLYTLESACQVQLMARACNENFEFVFHDHFLQKNFCSK